MGWVGLGVGVGWGFGPRVEIHGSCEGRYAWGRVEVSWDGGGAGFEFEFG